MFENMYYLVEVQDKKDGLTNPILVKNEDLAHFMTNFDNENYCLLGMHLLGALSLTYDNFIKK